MSFFQQSVLNKYFETLDSNAVSEGYKKFKLFFHDATIQANIKDNKEEQFQEGFLRELFGNILGYTMNPFPDYNLTTELKNETGAKKADGAILKDGKAIGVIELKGTNTTDLNKITEQGFNYKNNQANCVYVITSNFEKLRFYIHNSIDNIEFNLFTLTENDFRLLWLCLHKQNIFSGIPEKIKQESNSEEEKITKRFYSDYSVFKNELWQDLVKNNPAIDKLTLYKKSQKLIDRFLFIYFAEDKGLLPPNSVTEIIKQWEELKERDEYRKLYDRIKKYFGYMNVGYKGKQYEIFAYNGGLFQTDELLDTLIVGDEVLNKHLLTISNYNFSSEVDVNILGHIFEHSLSEIETITAELEGREHDTTKSKRKKDGVFYTPKYITKYIVENTVGKLCAEKKTEFEISEEEFARGRKNRKKETVKLLDDKLKQYRNWLLTITICDPACGSGAFLNQALDFLIKEHRHIDELNNALLGGSIVYPDIEKHILENNIYGVDINEESVEIARLSLWLRTAQKGRKLSSLNNNIKIGNSLIDDVTVAGDKAFNWQKEFADVFAHGGFDVVIGNPPYVDIKALPKNMVVNLFKIYKTADNRINLFSIFIERSLEILKDKGKFSFIIPSSLLTQESYKQIRKELLSKTHIDNIIRLPNESFGGGAGEVKVDTIIFTSTLTTIVVSPVEIIVYKGFERINEISSFNCDEHIFFDQKIWAKDENYIFRININENISDLLLKIETQTTFLSDCADFCLGLTPYDKYKGHTPEQINNRVFHASSKKDDTYKKLLAGNDVTRYYMDWNGEEWISYGDWLGASRQQRFFKEKRILIKQIIDWTDKKIWAALTSEELYNTQNAFNLIAKESFSSEYLLAIINSNLISFYHRKKYLEEYKDRFQKILIKDCKNFPIKSISKKHQQPFTELVNLMISLTKDFQNFRSQFLSLLQSKFTIEKLSTKLQSWYQLEFKEFLAELKKSKIKLSLAQEAEWMNYFNEQKQKAQQLKSEIDKADKEIDKMVYQLYNLTEEEIKIVEGK